jgi:hypothetical protein
MHFLPPIFGKLKPNFQHMKRSSVLFFGMLFLSFFGLMGTSCSRKSGCPAYESVHSKPGRNGELSTKRGPSELFPKSMRKKMGK